MNLCGLGIGSNLKSPARQLHLAIRRLQQLPHTTVLAKAPFYRNPAYGRKSQPMFSNTVVLINTRLTPFHLLGYCQEIEKRQGRTRDVRWGSRTLDIDLLFYENKSIRSQRLTIPHPLAASRSFVMVPLRSLISKYQKEGKLSCSDKVQFLLSHLP